MSERVLVPIDDSERAIEGLEFALDSRPDATFVVLHVREPIYTEEFLWQEPEGDGDAEELLETARSIADEHDAEIETVIREGTPSEEIVAYAEENPIDGIVMGSHGRSGASRVLLGSVAETVTRRSPVPVTVVR